MLKSAPFPMRHTVLPARKTECTAGQADRMAIINFVSTITGATEYALSVQGGAGALNGSTWCHHKVNFASVFPALHDCMALHAYTSSGQEK